MANEIEPAVPLLTKNGDMEMYENNYGHKKEDGTVEIEKADVEARKYSHQNDDMHHFLQLEWDENCRFSDGRQIDYVLAYEGDFRVRMQQPGIGNGVTPSGAHGAPGESGTTLELYDEEESSSEAGECEDDEVSRSTNSKLEIAKKKQSRRLNFETNLRRMGLQLEKVDISPLLGRTRFVLVHAPFSVLEKQAQIMGIKLPVKQSDVFLQDRSYLPSYLDQALAKLRLFEFDGETRKLLEEPVYFTAPYSSDRRQQFVNWDREDILFPNAERSRMVYDLLTRANYDRPGDMKRDMKHFGIERLLASSTYSAAYPLHQKMRPLHEIPKGGEISQREVLLKHWSSWKNIIKYQPLDCIKRYFGSKIAFYFAWLGYYTRSLYLAAFVGLFSVCYGLITISEDIVSNDICGSDGIGATQVLCPACDRYCDFQKLNNSCVYAKMSYLFDNGTTVVFAALMSIWATLFLEGWKRYHAQIAWKWGLSDVVVEEDTVRADFQFRVKTTRYNPVTQQDEPYLSGRKKFANFLASGVTVLFFLCLVIAVVFGMVVYRVICMRVLAVMDHPTVDSYAFLIVSLTAAVINLVVIIIMNMVYNSLAHKLTRWECPRTQADFDNSYTFKVFLFQFVNYYSSLFYIAFFKGLLSQLPGTRDHDGNVKIGGYRLEGCDAAGCFAELVIQLATIMCGRQFFSALIEYAYPNVMSLMRKWQFRVPVVVETREQRKERIREEKTKKAGSSMRRWEADYYLNPTYDQFLFDEYLEMVLQFGFVTLFVAAFPLAPLFAVLNNIMEIRIDANKFLCNTQRPMPAQAKNIGVWLNILDVISKASVTINALVIAFTSDFVPKTMYFLSNGSMIGYVDSSLSYFDATDFDFSHSQFNNVTACRFRGYRRVPCSLSFDDLHRGEVCDDNLGLSYEWWKIFAARLLFVVIFEHIVFMIKIVVEYVIPDIPSRIFVQQQRERYLLRKALIGDMAGGSPTRSPAQSAAHADREDIAFQPGSFDYTNDPTTGDLTYIDHTGGRKDTVTSMDSFVTAVPPPHNGSVRTLNDNSL